MCEDVSGKTCLGGCVVGEVSVGGQGGRGRWGRDQVEGQPVLPLSGHPPNLAGSEEPAGGRRNYLSTFPFPLCADFPVKKNEVWSYK